MDPGFFGADDKIFSEAGCVNYEVERKWVNVEFPTKEVVSMAVTELDGALVVGADGGDDRG